MQNCAQGADTPILGAALERYIFFHKFFFQLNYRNLCYIEQLFLVRRLSLISPFVLSWIRAVTLRCCYCYVACLPTLPACLPQPKQHQLHSLVVEYAIRFGQSMSFFSKDESLKLIEIHFCLTQNSIELLSRSKRDGLESLKLHLMYIKLCNPSESMRNRFSSKTKMPDHSFASSRMNPI